MSSRGKSKEVYRLNNENMLLRHALAAADMALEASPCYSDATKEYAEAMNYYEIMRTRIEEAGL